MGVDPTATRCLSPCLIGLVIALYNILWALCLSTNVDLTTANYRLGMVLYLCSVVVFSGDFSGWVLTIIDIHRLRGLNRTYALKVFMSLVKGCSLAKSAYSGLFGCRPYWNKNKPRLGTVIWKNVSWRLFLDFSYFWKISSKSEGDATKEEEKPQAHTTVVVGGGEDVCGVNEKEEPAP